MGLNVSKVSENALKEYLATRRDNLPKLFRISDHPLSRYGRRHIRRPELRLRLRS